MLTAMQIRTVTEPGVYTDGPGRYGLALLVKAGAYGIRKTFVQRMTIAGKRTNIGLGKTEFVTLAEARTWAFENARVNARGEPLPHGGKRRGENVVRRLPTVKTDDQGSVRLVKKGANNTGRDDVAAALVLAAGALSRAPAPRRPRYYGLAG